MTRHELLEHLKDAQRHVRKAKEITVNYNEYNKLLIAEARIAEVKMELEEEERNE